VCLFVTGEGNTLDIPDGYNPLTRPLFGLSGHIFLLLLPAFSQLIKKKVKRAVKNCGRATGLL